MINQANIRNAIKSLGHALQTSRASYIFSNGVAIYNFGHAIQIITATGTLADVAEIAMAIKSKTGGTISKPANSKSLTLTVK